MTTRNNPITKEKIKKVTARIEEIYTEPEYEYIANCPYCKTRNSGEVSDDNVTIKVNCYKCRKDFKVKIPKFY